MLLLAGLVLAALLVALLVLRTQTPPPRGVSLALPGGGSLVTLDGTSLLDAARQSALAYDRANNPLYCFLFPDAATRVAGLTWMFHRCDVRSPSEWWGLIPFSNLIGFRRHLPWVLGHYDGDGTMACSFVLHPHDFSLSLGELVMLGLPSMVFLWGWTTFRRLLGLLHMDDQLRDAVAPHVHGPYYMLQRMVVNPAFQGRGIGSKCLGRALEAIPCPQVLLSTQSERNVIFYSRLGFEVIATFTTDCEGTLVKSWAMRRIRT